MEKTILVALKSGVVVDRSVLVTLSSAQLQEQLGPANSVLQTAPKVRVVDNFASFFNSANMLALIEANNDDYKLIAEQAGITINDTEVAAMQRAVELRKEITDKMTPPVPPYPFAELPNGWVFDKFLELCNGNKSVRRIGGEHQLGLGAAKKLWQINSVWWGSVPNKLNYGPAVSISYGGVGYNRNVNSIRDNNFRIKLGCQTVERYELEQLALNQGWEFPAPKAK